MPVSTADREEVAHHGLPVPEIVVLAETDQDTGLSTLRLLGQLNHPLIYVLHDGRCRSTS